MRFGSWVRSLLGSGEPEWKTASTLELFKQIYGGREALTGDAITWKTALQVSTVLGCVRVIANGISQVPLKVFRESADGRSRLPATDHPLYRILYRRPNPWQSSYEYRQTLGFHLALTGNHFSFKNVANGRLVELLPFEPGCVDVVRESSGDLLYRVTLPDGSRQEFPPEVIWHVRGPSWNGWMGLEAVQMAREAIGLAMATERQHAKMHKNGVSTTGTYSIDGTLSPDQYKQLRANLAKSISDNSGAPMILDRGAKWLSQSMSGVDSQHLETRRLQIEEVCRAFGVMPIMVGHADKTATYASAEQMFLAHVVHTLSPWYECIEQSIDVNLLTDRDTKDGLYAKFVEEGLLRGSIEATANVLEKYVNGGLMTPNEGRAKLDMNPDSDPESDKLRVPANIVGKQPLGTPENNVKSARLDEMERKVGALQRQPDINVTINQEPVAVNVAPAPVNVKAGDITVQAAKAADVTVHPAGAPQVTVNVPPPAEVKAPVANVQVDVHVPQGAAPIVQNTVNVPQQPAPTVTFEATLPPLEVSVALPPRKSESQTDITRDLNGNIVKSQTKTKETDA